MIDVSLGELFVIDTWSRSSESLDDELGRLNAFHRITQSPMDTGLTSWVMIYTYCRLEPYNFHSRRVGYLHEVVKKSPSFQL